MNRSELRNVLHTEAFSQRKPKKLPKLGIPDELAWRVFCFGCFIRKGWKAQLGSPAAERSRNETVGDRTVTLFARVLLGRRRRPGRPRHADVTQAVRLEAQGVSRKEIYRRLGKRSHEEQHALKNAMRQRNQSIRRRALRKAQPPPPTNPTGPL